MSEAPELPHGVALRPLTDHRDERGSVAEFFRAEWPTSVTPRQWVMIRSAAGVMRGVHVHVRHDDYFVLTSGAVTVGLHDLRSGSPSDGCSVRLDLRDDAPAALIIPHGVAHGFLFHAASVFVLGASHYYDASDELGCHWRDPELRISWPAETAQVSPRDARLPSLRALRARIPPWRP